MAASLVVQVPAPSDNNEEAIVAEFRRRTGMNSSYSRQCLLEFNWQFETALNVFCAM